VVEGAVAPPAGRPRALLFDVFGTCVDWRSGVIAAGTALAARRGLSGIDWPALADAWRAEYQPRMEPVRQGVRPWTDLDTLHREGLDHVLAELGAAGLSDGDRAELTLAWHRLDPWPDAVEGLRRLRADHVVAPCSNGHIALIVALSRHGGLVWDAVLGAELARMYKPHPDVYLRSVAALGLEPPEVMMVAAHNGDLAAAARCGLRTAFVPRPTEHGSGQTTDLHAGADVDVVAADLMELADRLSATGA